MFKFNSAGKKFALFTCLILLCIVYTSKAQNKGIQFETYSWQKLLVKAGAENKMIFVDCYTTWCGPCKYLAKNIFPMQQMGEYFNRHFISVSYDMEQEPGISLKKRFGIMGYPTLLILNPRGYKVDRMIGNPNVDTLLAADSLIKWAKKSIDHTLPTAEEEFDKGNRSVSTISNYLKTIILNNELPKAQAVLHNAIIKDGINSVLQFKYWNVIEIADVNSAEVSYILNNKQLFYNRYGKDETDGKLTAIFTGYNQLDQLTYGPPIRKVNMQVYEAYLKKIKDKDPDHYNINKNIIDFYLACKNYHLSEATKITQDMLSKGADWRYYRVAKMADELIYNQQERNYYAGWALKAAPFIKAQSLKLACIAIANNLTHPLKDNDTHSHFELPDFK